MYSIKKVSELLNISTVTIRAWENRYQLVQPVRTPGGHRLYTEADVATLRWVKQQMEEQDIKISEAVSLLKQKSADSHPLTGYTEEWTAQRINNNAYEELVNSLYGDLILLNTEQAHFWIDLAFSMYHHNIVFHSILTPVLYRIGDEWENGVITVAQEHYATELIMQRCSQFLRTLPTLQQLPKALALCPQGEHHHMGLMLFSLFLRNKGMDVTYTGPDTPLQDIGQLIEIKKFGVIAISLSDPRIAASVADWVTGFTAEHPQIHVVLGGKGFEQLDSALSGMVLPGYSASWEHWFQTAISG